MVIQSLLEGTKNSTPPQPRLLQIRWPQLHQKSDDIPSMDTPHQNFTRVLEALSPYINSPRQTIIRIEASVALATLLLFLQFIIGPCRWRSSHWFIQGALWLSYTLSFPLIAYTIGQMVSSPIKNELYPLWVVILFWGLGCTNSITAYALQDNKQWKRYFLELNQYYFYSCSTYHLLTPDSSALGSLFRSFTLLGAASFVTNLARVMAGWMVTNPFSSIGVADYMRDQVDRQETTFDPITLKGCTYIINYYGKVVLGPTYRSKINTEYIVTVNTIWELGEFDDRKSGACLPWKDVCLLFALSRLLKRRFDGMDCAEADLPVTRNFILKGLLKQKDKDNNYTRAFQIIEVELGFLCDFFFTKYAALAEVETFSLIMAVCKLYSISICGGFLLGGSFSIKTSEPLIEVGTSKVDVTITVMIIGALWLVEAPQIILYVTSDWATISIACSHTRGVPSFRKLIPSVIWYLRRFNLSRTKFGKFLDRLNLLGYWQNKMGQSSVIQGCVHVSSTIMYVNPFKYLTDLCLSMIYPRKTFVVVPDLVKREIVSCLQELSKKGGPLNNGKAVLDRNTNFGEFDWTLSKANSSQTMIMLIWHIATEYCNIASSNEADQSDPHRHVATTLSRYCAYLMSFIPDLLPGNSTDTALVNHGVLLEGRKLLRGRKPISMEALLEAIHTSATCNNNVDTLEQRSTGNNNNEDVVAQDSTDNNNNDEVNNNEVPVKISSNNEDTMAQDLTDSNNDEDSSIFIKGLKLGRALENKGVGRWKVLAEFWAETIIFIAPSDNAAAHMERLAHGGEFLTHIWALLNHAGILKRDHDLAPEDMAQP